MGTLNLGDETVIAKAVTLATGQVATFGLWKGFGLWFG